MNDTAHPHPCDLPRRRDDVRLAVRIDDAGSSGVIDVHTLCPDGATLGPARTRLATPRPVARPRDDRSILWALTATAIAAVGSLVAVAIASSPTPTIVVRDPAAPPHSLVGMELDSDTPPEVSAPETIDLAGDDADVHDDDPAQAADEPPAPAPAPVVAAPAPPTKPRASSKRRAARTAAPKPEAASKREPTKADTALPPVECILDPTSCRTTADGATKPKARRDEDLPDKLTASALRTHLADAKRQAKQCGPRHGASSGTRVQVKLSIRGETGRVTSATALGDDAGAALGRCVAEALGDATFPRFSAPSQGVVYTVTL